MKIPTGAGTGKKSCLQTEEEMGKLNFPCAVGSGVLTMVKILAKGLRRSAQWARRWPEPTNEEAEKR